MKDQAMTVAVSEQLDQCVGCGCDLEIHNTHELYLQRRGLCTTCNERKEQDECIRIKH